MRLPTGDQMSLSIEDEANIKFVDYVRNSANRWKVIPNMILNQVDIGDVTIPKH